VGLRGEWPVGHPCPALHRPDAVRGRGRCLTDRGLCVLGRQALACTGPDGLPQRGRLPAFFFLCVSCPLLTIPLPNRVSMLCCDVLASPVFFPRPPMQVGWRRPPRPTAPPSGSGKTTGTTRRPTMTLSAACARSWRRTCRRRPPQLAARRRPSRPSMCTLSGEARRGATLAGGERRVAGRPPAVWVARGGASMTCAFFFLFFCLQPHVPVLRMAGVAATGLGTSEAGTAPVRGRGRDRRRQQETNLQRATTPPHGPPVDGAQRPPPGAPPPGRRRCSADPLRYVRALRLGPARHGRVVARADLLPVDHIPDGVEVGHLVVLVLQVKGVL